MIKAALIGAGQRGTYVYGEYALRYPHQMKIVAVAEANEERRKSFVNAHKIDNDYVFSDWQTLLAKEKLADVMIIATSDDLHFEPLKQSLEKGYHILLEKPMTNNEAELAKMKQLVENYPDRIICVSHVLRYAPFFEFIKKKIDKGSIGQVMTIAHNENIGYFHMAHSYVRGNWRNSNTSSPIILAKSCHDMDILLYLVGSHCKKIASFGSLSHFCKENMPKGAAKRCIDCFYQDTCPYSAPKIYKDVNSWPGYVITNDHSPKGRMEALKNSDYGRCVYQSDNNVCDHQTTIIEFENGVTATFHLSAFSHDTTRIISVMGTHGEIRGDLDRNLVEIFHFDSHHQETIHIDVPETQIGHGGGDIPLIRDFIYSIENYEPSHHIKTSALLSIESHEMAYAAEKSRLTGQVIKM